jgi:hypothetical protein
MDAFGEATVRQDRLAPAALALSVLGIVIGLGIGYLVYGNAHQPGGALI